MRKKPATKSQSTNSLKDKLEKGLPIKNMVGFVPFGDDATVYIKVKVIKFETEGCGLSVLVEPVSGAGTFTITPCKWVDSPKDIAYIKEQMQRRELAEKEAKTILRNSYLKVRKRDLADYVETRCSSQQRNDYYDEIETQVGERSLTEANESFVRRLALIVTYQVNCVDEEPDTDRRYW